MSLGKVKYSPLVIWRIRLVIKRLGVFKMETSFIFNTFPTHVLSQNQKNPLPLNSVTVMFLLIVLFFSYLCRKAGLSTGLSLQGTVHPELAQSGELVHSP